MSHSIIYLLLVPNTAKNILLLAVLLFYQTALLSYVFLLNSLTDKKIDCAVGKSFALEKFPNWFVYFVLVATGLVTIAIPLYFNPVAQYIGIISFLLATFYSANPLRLKTKGVAGILVAGFSTSLPFLFFVSIIGENPLLGIFIFGVLFLRHLAGELLHQIEDYENDKKTETRTLAVRIGKDKTKKLTKAIITFYSAYVFLSLLFGLEGIVLLLVILLFSIHQIVWAHNW